MNGYAFYKVSLAGIAPLIQHNGQTADPLNPFSKKLKEISGKRPKTDADLAKMAEIEFKAGLYVDRTGSITIDGRIIEATVHAGAKKTKAGKIALAAMFIEPGCVFTFDGPTDIEERWADEHCRLTIGVRVGQAKVMRTRPIFENWKLEFTLSILEDQANGETVRQWIEDAGKLVGMGDWRPRYGRFAVESFERVDLAKAA